MTAMTVLLFSIFAITGDGVDQSASDGHREVPAQPPATQMPQDRSPGRRVIRGANISVQVNVDAQGNNIVGDAANEPSIAVDPSNRNRMVIGWRQFDSIASNFREAGWAYSQDRGGSWTFPGAIEDGTFRSDPVLAADSQGVFYYNSLAGNFQCSVFRSFDGGKTWDGGTPAFGGDKQWMCIDQTAGMGNGNIYSVWNVQFTTCGDDMTRSYDTGDSYEACEPVPTSPRWGTMTVGKNGELFIAGAGFVVIKSSTLQDPNEPVAYDFTAAVDLGGSIGSSSGPNPGGLLGQADVGVDRSDGPNGGNVYLLCSVNPPGPDPMDVSFARSEDGGMNWSNAVRINDDSGDNWQWFATMSVAPDGRIDAVWNDTRDNPGTHMSELYYSYSEDGGRSWRKNVAVSPSFDPSLGYPGQNKIGDYYDMRSDNEGVDIAYTATFNGEQDVYFLRITHAPVPPCPLDLNGDEQISELDVAIAIAAWAGPGELGDVDGDGRITVLDVLTIHDAIGLACE